MIKLKNVSKYYSKNQTVSLGLRKINLEIGLNEFVVIVGESGSGKTTLLNIISGLDSYEEGEMFINNEETSYYSVNDWEDYRKEYIAFIFQNYHLIESYTVLQNVEAALILSNYPKDKIRARAIEIINRVGLGDHVKHKASKLSGGQKQRTVIARAIAKDCPIIVADEPTGNLDSESADIILKLLQEISKDKLVILVTHDFNQVKDYATRKIRIFDGEIVENKVIKKTEVKEIENKNLVPKEVPFKNMVKMVFNNLTATPKKTILMTLVFLLASLFFGYIYGYYSLQTSSQFYSYNQYFNYRPETRLVLSKNDLSQITDDEMAWIKDKNLVQHIIPYDFLLDSVFDFRIDDLRTGATLMLPDSIFPDIDVESGSVYLALPENQRRNSLLEQDVAIYFNRVVYRLEIDSLLNLTDFMKYQVEDYDSVVIVDDSDWEELAFLYAINHLFFYKLDYESTEGANLSLDTRYLGLTFGLSKDLSRNEVLVKEGLLYDYSHIESGRDLTLMLSLNGVFNQLNLDEAEATVATLSNTDIVFSYDLISELFGEENLYQLSIIVGDRIDANQLMRDINNYRIDDDNVFKAIFPNELDTNSFDGFAVLLGILITLIITFYFMVAFLISYIIIKTIINTKLNDYAIFRTIGANKRVVRNFIYFESIFISMFSVSFFIIVLLVTRPYISNDSALFVLKYLHYGQLAFLWVFMIGFSILLSLRYVSRVYKNTVSETLRGGVE